MNRAFLMRVEEALFLLTEKPAPAIGIKIIGHSVLLRIEYRSTNLFSTVKVGVPYPTFTVNVLNIDKMKKNAFIYLATCGLCLFFLTACPIKVETVRIRSYVVEFMVPTAFQMQLTDNNNIVLYWSNFSQRVSFRDTGSAGRLYNELAARYNDLSYNRITRFMVFPMWRSYVSNGIVSIDVKSNKAFDAEHPADTSLASFVRLLSASPIRFIESGYRETFDWYNNYPVDFLRETATFHQFIGHDGEGRRLHPNHFPISEVLSVLEPDDFRLLGIGDEFPLPSGWVWFFGFLVFDKEPDSPGTHNLTVTIRRSGGRVFSQTIEKTFGG